MKFSPNCPRVKLSRFSSLLPVAVRIHLVDEHSAVLSTVTGQITLCVAIEVQPPNSASSLHRLLPHGRVDRLSAPCDLAGSARVHGQQPCHLHPFFSFLLILFGGVSANEHVIKNTRSTSSKLATAVAPLGGTA